MFINFNNEIIKTVMESGKKHTELGTLGTTTYRNTEQRYYLE